MLQEIESLIALRVFNERYLGGHYTQALLVDSRDYRQIDVGVLAAPTVQLDQVRTHVDLLAKPGEQFKPDWPWQFSRDCLEVEARLPGGRTFTVFVNHFKSKFVQPKHGQTKDDIAAERKAAAEYRLRQSTAVLDLVHARFPGNGFDKRWFAVAGDFNSLSAESPAQTFATAGLDDVVARLPADQRWTEYFSGGGSVGQLDYLFLSAALAAATAGQQPVIERRGIGMRDTSKTDGGPLPKLARLEVSDDLPPATSIDFEELLAERGITVDHVTVYRCVQTFTPEFVDAARPSRHSVGNRWFVDEHLRQGRRPLDLPLPGHRSARPGHRRPIVRAPHAGAARAFFTRALKVGPVPVDVTTDGAPVYPRVLDELVPAARHVIEQHANNVVEADHGRLKARLRPMRGLKRPRSARIIAAGHAFIQNLRRGHYDVVADEPPLARVRAAFDQVARCI